MKLIESETIKNLANSFAGECQAMVRYKFIEYGARMQGFEQLAQQIDKLVYNEFNHARMFYTKIQDASKDTITNIEVCSGYPFKEKWDLAENLKLASEDEKDEFAIVYPHYRDIALKEGFKDIAQLYDDIIQVESCHHKILHELHRQVADKTMYKKTKSTKWKCGSCGYEAEGKEAWDECPLCLEKQGTVMLKIPTDQ